MTTSLYKIKKVLIANRGEIACRLISGARSLGYQTVAVFSDADAQAKFVRMADEAICIGPPPSVKSYLNRHAIIQAATCVGADAIHPGYGFLSENAVFAQEVIDAGMVWVGPHPGAISAMGDKVSAKDLAKRAGVSVIPGSDGAVATVEALDIVALDIGYPLILKPAAGGGGRGMRIVQSHDGLHEAFHSAVSEATTSFGDGRVFVERYVSSPRHIEIQVLGDKHGHIIHLGERECSIQRRHQKVLEEAPSPLLDDHMRDAMGEQALMLARAVDYDSAGTVEFIVDEQKRFYFLEMNTRLQVEHPVTEAVTGVDIVGWMLRIARGEKLSLSQSDIHITGHAMEARVCAEDPLADFLPSSGRITAYHMPDNVRVDSGVEDGCEIPVFYDSMIAKVISHAPTRQESIAVLQAALDQCVVKGVSHNIPLLQAILSHDVYQSGEMTTHFIEQYFPKGLTGHGMNPDLIPAFLIAAAYSEKQYLSHIQNAHSLPSLGQEDDGLFYVQLGDATHTIGKMADGGWQVDGVPHQVTIATTPYPASLIHMTLDGVSYVMQTQTLGVSQYCISYRDHTLVCALYTKDTLSFLKRFGKKSTHVKQAMMKAPMPGLVIDVLVEKGQIVQAGQSVLVLEAMKMENILRADNAGLVSDIFVAKGDTVSVKQKLLNVQLVA